MALSSGALIEIVDYNDLALEVNRLFSDNNTNMDHETSNVILDDTAAGGGEAGGATRLLSPQPTSDDFLVVTVDDVTLLPTVDYTVDYNDPVTITYIDPLAGNAVLKAYDRTSNRFGWAQQASVHPITAGDAIVRADEETLQAYLEANMNNLVDKVNIMEVRTGGPTELTRVAQGALIYATDKTIITSTIDTDILSGSNYWNNEVATISGSVLTDQRTTAWNNNIASTMQFTWDSYDDLRYFFNTGNELRCNIVMTGDPANQGFNNWNQVVTDLDTVILNYETVSQTGINGKPQNLGSYHLTSTFQTVYISGSPQAPVDDNGDFDPYGSYATLVVEVQARLINDVPSAGDVSIEIRLVMDDQALNTQAEGTTTGHCGYKLADDVIDNSATFATLGFVPTITNVESFIDGN